MRPRLVFVLAAVTLAAIGGTALHGTSPSVAATMPRSCSTVKLDAGLYGGIQTVHLVTLGRASCREALHLAHVYYGRLATNRCGHLNNFCDLTLPGRWSCSIFSAAESTQAGGASAGCFRVSNGAKVRFYGTGQT